MAKKYSDIITIRESKPAYNIENEQAGEWNMFIANEQFNGVLKKVVDSVFNNYGDDHKSFWISGTYGTGKSHAGAVIKHLLCDHIEDIEEFVKDEYSDAKYQLLNSSLLKLRSEKRLFPVTIYGQKSISHRDDFSLVIQKEITNALLAADINIAVKTDFENYISHIDNDPDFWDMMIGRNPALASLTPNRQKLINELKRGDITILHKVKDTLREGHYDIRLNNANITQWFFEVQDKIAELGTYNGLLVIWDEFTELMKSDVGLSVLGSLQEITERGMNSENNSYFLLISHPSALDSLKAEDREKTKGRYHYMHYKMEPVSAFKIMSRKFKVSNDEGCAGIYNDKVSTFFSNNASLLDIYTTLSNNKEETKNDIKNLFPLHPSTANLATYYAREAGSASRSVFEFLGSNKAIKDFFDDTVAYENKELITANYLWDYIIEELNTDILKFGAVTERYNSRKLEVEHKGKMYLDVFKSVLLLNALNNIANNETVTPSETNIRNLYIGTAVEDCVDDILEYFNEDGIIQCAPGGLYSIQFSALPTTEIAEIKDRLRSTNFKYTHQIINFGDTAKVAFETFLKGVTRPNRFFMYSEDSNESTLLSKIENGYKQAKSYEVCIAMLFAKNAAELNTLKDIAERACASNRFENVVFVVFDSILTDNSYERFIEYQANATCAQNHGFADQLKSYMKSSSEAIKEWTNDMRRGNFTFYIRGDHDMNASTKLASTINSCVSPVIFKSGVETLPIIQTQSSLTYWRKASVKKTVDNILSFNCKTDIMNSCNGPEKHVQQLLQDSVDENLEWLPNIDTSHPLYVIVSLIDKRFKDTNKNAQFNLADRLADLTKPPYGLYQSYAGMGMVAFAMRKYIKQIFDPNGKPREAQHLVDDIVEMFKVWEEDKQSNKLNFMFESKESNELCKNLIQIFRLRELSGYNDISSLVDARWAILHEYSDLKGYPLWSLKYSNTITTNSDINVVIDNILKVCQPDGIRNPKLLGDTLHGIKKYTFELGNILNIDNVFEDGFCAFLMSFETVRMQANQFAEAKESIVKNLGGDRGLWTEEEVEKALLEWIIAKQRSEGQISGTNGNFDFTPQDNNTRGEPTYVHIDQSYASAKNNINEIHDINKAKRLLEALCNSRLEVVLNIINNFDV